MKRMAHPLHGFHHAMDANEEARMRTNGWTAEDDAPAPVEEIPRAETTAEDDAPVMRRRGRPPVNKD